MIWEPTARLNPAQQEVVDRDLLGSGFSCVLQLPTGAGKTWLAERAIAETIERGGRAIYLTPLRALANELLERWKRSFSGHEIGVFTGEYGGRQRYPVPFERASVLIMTPERLDACTRHWRSHWAWIPAVDLIVADEFHLLGDPSRGARLEGALSRIRRLNPHARIVGLSATLGNADELADWLGGVSYRNDWRPLPLEWKVVSFQKATDKPGLLEEQVRQCVAAGGQSLVFVQSRRRAEQLSEHLRQGGLNARHHHAGLQTEVRHEVEGRFRAKCLQVLVATSTLEMGLNLPARQVVLYDLQGFDGHDFVPLDVNTVWQRAGRAGRRGFDEQGEVVLLAPSWDRDTSHYLGGKFERIMSGLRREAAVAEQILAEVASGMARTRIQLDRVFTGSLAHHQRALPKISLLIDKMLSSQMLSEIPNEGGDKLTLRATRLGRIAVRQMLSPDTVLRLSEALLGEDRDHLTLFDLLLLCTDTPDCKPLIPADFEDLEMLAAALSAEPSTLLSKDKAGMPAHFRCKGRRVLACVKTALVARAWTRSGDAESVAKEYGCYTFEIRRLTESLERILTAGTAVITPPKDGEDEEKQSILLEEEATLEERVRALASMVTHGIDEEAVTLTFLPGVGGTVARRLQEVGISSIDDLCIAEPDEVAMVRGVSLERAVKWIEAATEMIKTRSAFAFREMRPEEWATSSCADWPSSVDPYRFRRSLELKVTLQRRYQYEVSGGLEPHRVVAHPERPMQCDCADFAKGNHCKHLLAVRLHRKDPDLLELRERLQSTPGSIKGLDVFQLWFEGR